MNAKTKFDRAVAGLKKNGYISPVTLNRHGYIVHMTYRDHKTVSLLLDKVTNVLYTKVFTN